MSKVVNKYFICVYFFSVKPWPLSKHFFYELIDLIIIKIQFKLIKPSIVYTADIIIHTNSNGARMWGDARAQGQRPFAQMFGHVRLTPAVILTWLYKWRNMKKMFVLMTITINIGMFFLSRLVTVFRRALFLRPFVLLTDIHIDFSFANRAYAFIIN